MKQCHKFQFNGYMIVRFPVQFIKGNTDGCITIG